MLILSFYDCCYFFCSILTKFDSVLNIVENVLDFTKWFLSSSSKVLQISAFPLLLYYYDIIDDIYYFL